MDVYHAEVFIEERFTLGECPVWDERASRLYWADIKGNRVHSADESGFNHLRRDFGQNVGCFALDREGGLILGLTSGLYRLRADGRYQRLPLKTPPLTRFNDGKCDPKGRFWCGGTELFEGGWHDRASLYLVEDDEATEVFDGVGCSNGLAFSVDCRKLWYIDTPRRRVDVIELAGKERRPGKRREAFEVPERDGYPDGMAMDADGNLWIAHWGAGYVACHRPDGEIVAKVVVPASKSSSCCFGGPDMRTLFVTTAAEDIPEEREPLAGSVFCARLPVAGAMVGRYAG